MIKKDNYPHIIMFRSRNKDNKNVPGFKERTKVFLTTDKDYTAHSQEFQDFIERGVDSEMSRMYVSVNARNPEKVKTALICKMLQDDNFDLRNLNRAMISVAMQKENAAQKRWMFDFDDDPARIDEFINDVMNEIGDQPYARMTPNGYAVIVEHGFDTRNLMNKWGCTVELKRDDFLCVDWGRKVPEDYRK